MNSYLRFIYAILFSLLVHITLVTWMQQHKQFRGHDEQGIMQVTLQHFASHETVVLLNKKINLADNNKEKSKQDTSIVTAVQMTDSIYVTSEANGISSKSLQGAPSPIVQQNQFMIAMQQAQVAQQLALRKEAIRAGLTNLTFQLRPLILENINCIQKTGDQFECRPIQNEETQKMLKQYFDLAGEANKVGIAENPLRLDFGSGRSVRMTLQP